MDTNNTPIYQAFEWYRPNTHRATVPAYVLAKQGNMVRDISAGVGVILSMLERDRLAHDDGEPQILGNQDAATLLRHAIRSMEMLRDESERLTDWASEHATPSPSH